MDLITLNSESIKAVCHENHVRTLFAFGSVVREDFGAQSDVDFVVDIDSSDPLTYSDHYFALKFQLEKILRRHVDLLESRAIRNRFLLEAIENSKVLVYGKGN